jgi:hypothetical protein
MLKISGFQRICDLLDRGDIKSLEKIEEDTPIRWADPRIIPHISMNSDSLRWIENNRHKFGVNHDNFYKIIVGYYRETPEDKLNYELLDVILDRHRDIWRRFFEYDTRDLVRDAIINNRISSVRWHLKRVDTSSETSKFDYDDEFQDWIITSIYSAEADNEYLNWIDTVIPRFNHEVFKHNRSRSCIGLPVTTTCSMIDWMKTRGFLEGIEEELIVVTALIDRTDRFRILEHIITCKTGEIDQKKIQEAFSSYCVLSALCHSGSEKYRELVRSGIQYLQTRFGDPSRIREPFPIVRSKMERMIKIMGFADSEFNLDMRMFDPYIDDGLIRFIKYYGEPGL